MGQVGDRGTDQMATGDVSLPLGIIHQFGVYVDDEKPMLIS
jgi:hypothetical protein